MNLFELAAKITLDGSSFEKGIEKAKNGMTSLANHIGSGLKKAAKVGTAAVGVATTGIAALTKMSVSSFADYEQLVGGVETLFKNSAEEVQFYADNAYKTAGLSANEYMETVTSFSASLLQSLDGDTNKAAKYANQALTDMSDNANKMGSDMGLIQNAYNGFAKANYTMLDNLKLGYGGTQAEMQRLIADAAKLDSSVDASSMSFGNIVKAIHAVQTEMGITGTTAKEAASTISGSVGMMKASWKNLLTGVADDNANFDMLINNFVDSVGVAAQNILPRVEIALNGAVKLVTALAPKIIAEIPVIVEKIIPNVISGAVKIVNSLVSAIPELVSVLLPAIAEQSDYIIQDILSTVLLVGQKLVESAPVIIDSLAQIMQSIFLWIGEYHKVFLDTGIELLESFAEGIASNSGAVSSEIETTIQMIVSDFLDALPKILEIGAEILTSLAEGIANRLPEMVPAVVKVILTVVDTVINNLDKILDAALKIIKALAQGIINSIPTLVQELPRVIGAITSFIIEHLPDILAMGLEIIANLVEGIIQSLPDLYNSAGDMLSEICDGIGNGIDRIFDLGGQLIDKLRDGISNAWNGFVNWWTGLWNSVFGSNDVNVNINANESLSGGSRGPRGSHAAGLDYVPFDNYVAKLHKGERVLTRSEAQEYRTGKSGTTIEKIDININGAKYQDETSLAEAVAEALQNMIERKENAYV